ncbi:MAG TPA: HD domain-containing phosphohydrolase, partial [Fimbriimonas sp.]|nr:HD domain-containing phosphohydrolase [Fimbriimonas sp.]
MERANPSLAEILEALSHALDITEGQPRGHAARTCLITARIGEALQLSQPERDNLFYASLIKDAGCSTNSARIHMVFGGDELLAKKNVKLVDWSNPLKSVGYAVANAEPGAPPMQRIRRMLGMIGPPTKVMDEVTAARCFRGADIAKMLGFNEQVANAIRHLDEHWDGKGSPTHMAGDEIPLLARILCLAQTLEVFVSELGPEAGFEMIRERSGRWFDPSLVQTAFALQKDEAFWSFHRSHVEGQAPSLKPPHSADSATEADVDQVCHAFASIVDAKSSFTAEHSERVTRYALEIAEDLGLDDERKTTLRRASLLHDIGKLGVPNSILDKPARLTDEEFDRVKLHPRFSYEILSRVSGFDRVAEIAASHHERL